MVVRSSEYQAEESVSFQNTAALQALEQLIKACNSASVIEVHGKRIALFNVGGTFRALDDTCPHRGGRLGKQSMDGNVITCPSHHWKFDVTTGCVRRPAGRESEVLLRQHPGQRRSAGSGFCCRRAFGRHRPSALRNAGTLELVCESGAGRLQPHGTSGRANQPQPEARRNPELGVATTPNADDGAPGGKLLRRMADEDKLQDRGCREGEATRLRCVSATSGQEKDAGRTDRCRATTRRREHHLPFSRRPAVRNGGSHTGVGGPIRCPR